MEDIHINSQILLLTPVSHSANRVIIKENSKSDINPIKSPLNEDGSIPPSLRTSLYLDSQTTSDDETDDDSIFDSQKLKQPINVVGLKLKTVEPEEDDPFKDFDDEPPKDDMPALVASEPAVSLSKYAREEESWDEGFDDSSTNRLSGFKEYTYLNNKLEEIKSVEKQVIEKASTLIYDDYLQRCLLEILQAKSKQIDSCFKRNELSEKDYTKLKETLDMVHKKIISLAGRLPQTVTNNPTKKKKVFKKRPQSKNASWQLMTASLSDLWESNPKEQAFMMRLRQAEMDSQASSCKEIKESEQLLVDSAHNMMKGFMREAASTIANELFTLLLQVLDENTSRYLAAVWRSNEQRKGWMASTKLLYKMLQGLERYQDMFTLQIMRRRVKEWKARAELLQMEVNKKN